MGGLGVGFGGGISGWGGVGYRWGWDEWDVSEWGGDKWVGWG